MTLNLESLRKSVESLERALQVSKSPLALENPVIEETIQAGVIQNFEVAFELCWKFIQRWIRTNRSSEEADYPRTRKELFRAAAAFGLIDDPSPWFEYGDARNLATHTYDEERAEEVYRISERFLGDAQALLRRLEDRND